MRQQEGEIRRALTEKDPHYFEAWGRGNCEDVSYWESLKMYLQRRMDLHRGAAILTINETIE